MQLQEQKPRIKPQACPFCGQEQEVLIVGHYPNPEGDNHQEIVFDPDRGYSFCNCKNVFYTDWSNIEQAVYDADYSKKYSGEFIGNLLCRYLNYYAPYWKPLMGKGLLEMGTVNEALLDEAKIMGFKPCGMDIFEREAKHPMIWGNFETVDLAPYKESFGVIVASHIFEHFRDPLAVLRKCHGLLEKKGRILIAMPDPFFIDWSQPHKWGHWHLQEHHIMWDMDSFAKEMESAGFRILLKRHNPDTTFICIGDFHIVAEKI